MTDNNTTVTVELSSNVEIKDAADFAMYARALNVPVGERGRKPFSALLAAIDADDRFTLVETDYFGRDKANGNQSQSAYQAAAKALRVQRDTDIAAIRETYSKALAALKTEHDVTESSAPAPGKTYRVTAVKPQRDRAGNVKRNKAGDRVLFAPSPSTVDLTAAEIREHLPEMPSKGRPSSSHALRAAVVKGDWLPVDMLDTEGWETVLLSNPTVEVIDTPVETDAA